ncbi:uncharacterized protein LOC143630135 [Bidens hawaiensis]|uniref:uncharacterized protein LOC143630135 n=1 Tax=Bidens hawaiensis TaxID=980011 RepID=UPI00404A46A5
MQQTGKKEEEVDRATLWKEARKNKTGDFDENVQVVVNKIRNELVRYTKWIGVKLNWVNARCPCQPGSTECGYFMLKFMKEIVDEGIKILLNDNVGGGNNEYTDADIDGIREEWSTFVASFIYR